MKTRNKQAPRRHAGGRPPKFPGPRRVVTLTLPERTLSQLGMIDNDRARAIAEAAERVVGDQVAVPPPPVEVIRVAPGAGLILVGPCRHLAEIPFLRMVQVAPGRHLITLQPGVSPDSLEIALVDLLDDIPEGETAERRVVDELRRQIKGLRQDRRVTKAEILFVSL